MAYYSNGTEGEVFDEQCAECIHGINDEVYCPIALVQASYNYDQLRDGQGKVKEILDILVSQKDGCKMKPIIDKIRAKKLVPKCLTRKLVFGDEEQIKALNMAEKQGGKIGSHR